jgi:phosphomannomutase
MFDYSQLFKAYDVRGTVPFINAEVYYWTGYGLVTQVLQPENLPMDINLFRDTRYSSPEFYKAMYYGILDAGGNPIALGLGSSDTMYASCQLQNTPGAMITASHNPKDDNGVKILKIGSTALGLDEGLDKIRDFVVANIEKKPFDLSDRPEPIENTELKTKVVDFFATKIRQIGEIDSVDKIMKERNIKLKIAVDAGNGMGGFIMDIVKDMYSNIEFVPLYWELDGQFPNHPADPQTYANLRDLQEVVKDPTVDFGFAFDGDADRVFFVDEKSNIVNGDFLVAFFAKSLVASYHKNPNPSFNPAVVYAQPGSRCVLEAVSEVDGVVVPSQQGHTKIKALMKKYKAIYGGEFSGHHYFSDFGYLDSGILAAVLMIKILVEEKKHVSECFTRLNKSYFISDLMNLTIPAGMDFATVESKLKAHFTDGVVSNFDGISIFYPDWKFSMRPSNTEPKIRFILESKINNITAEKVAEVRSVIGF